MAARADSFTVRESYSNQADSGISGTLSDPGVGVTNIYYDPADETDGACDSTTGTDSQSGSLSTASDTYALGEYESGGSGYTEYYATSGTTTEWVSQDGSDNRTETLAGTGSFGLGSASVGTESYSVIDSATNSLDEGFSAGISVEARTSTASASSLPMAP